MTPARDWMTMPQQPLDVVFVPSAMGHATSIGLGLALAQPDAPSDRVQRRRLDADEPRLTRLDRRRRRDEPRRARVRQWRLRGDGSAADAGAGAVDFAAIARGAGFPLGVRVRRAQRLAGAHRQRSAVRRARRSPGCAWNRRWGFLARGPPARPRSERAGLRNALARRPD